jgi:hypothetical protein
MPSKDRGKHEEKKPAKGPAPAATPPPRGQYASASPPKGAPAQKGKYAAEAPKMEGKQKKAKLHKDKRGRGAK